MNYLSGPGEMPGSDPRFYGFTPPGGPSAGPSDTVPAWLTPGEAVLNRGAAQLAGRGNIDNLNRAGGAAGYAQGIGYVDPKDSDPIWQEIQLQAPQLNVAALAQKAKQSGISSEAVRGLVQAIFKDRGGMTANYQAAGSPTPVYGENGYPSAIPTQGYAKGAIVEGEYTPSSGGASGYAPFAGNNRRPVSSYPFGALSGGTPGGSPYPFGALQGGQNVIVGNPPPIGGIEFPPADMTPNQDLNAPPFGHHWQGGNGDPSGAGMPTQGFDPTYGGHPPVFGGGPNFTPPGGFGPHTGNTVNNTTWVWNQDVGGYVPRATLNTGGFNPGGGLFDPLGGGGQVPMGWSPFQAGGGGAGMGGGGGGAFPVIRQL